MSDLEVGGLEEIEKQTRVGRKLVDFPDGSRKDNRWSGILSHEEKDLEKNQKEKSFERRQTLKAFSIKSR